MRVALAAILAFAMSPVAAAQAPTQDAARPDSCAPLDAVFAAAPRRFRALRTQEFSTQFESYRTHNTLQGFDSCWSDDTSPTFWCLAQPERTDAAHDLTLRMIDEVSRCFPLARRQQWLERHENGIERYVTDWTISEERRARVVERRRPGGQPGTAYIYLY
jgi:hypothetical protein